MLSVLRFPVAVVIGGTLTMSVFWLLWHLVGRTVDGGGVKEATRIDFTRMRRDTEVQTKREEKVQRERPPPTPEVPQMAFSAGGVENTVARFNPVVDARGAMTRMNMSAGSDRDVIPLVRIAPDYPPRALARGIEGWVQVQFTITATGTVKDPKVVNSDPKNIFDDAALKSISRWRYNPRVEGGVAVERVGIQTIIRFQLDN